MISVFAKPTYLLDDYGTSMRRISSRVRGEEVAEYLGAKFNPKDGYDYDVRIYVKPRRLSGIKEGAYIDVLDDWRLVEELKGRPDLKVISMSLSHHEFLQKELANEIFLIPHHHVNFERITRKKDKITTCGYVGTNSYYHVSVNNQIKKALKAIGLDFKPLFNFQSRQDIIDYYQTVDIQVIGYFDYLKDTPYYHPTKIINAMAFGIPTIAGPRLGYSDVEGFYTLVSDLNELVHETKKMKEGWDAQRLIDEAEKYHTDNIAKLYKQL